MSLLLTGAGIVKSEAEFASSASAWMAAAYDRHLPLIVREKGIASKASATKFSKAILADLVAGAAEARAIRSTKISLSAAKRVEYDAATGDWDRIKAVAGAAQGSTLSNYLSGAKKAAALGKPWEPRSHIDLPNPWTEGTSTKDGTTSDAKRAGPAQAVSVDKKARKVEFVAGRKVKLPLDEVAAVVAAITSTEETFTLAKAWCKAHNLI